MYGLGISSQVQPLSLVLPFLSVSTMNPGCFCHPAVGRDEIRVVLHGLGPVVHEVLIDVVGVEQRRLAEGGEQVLGDALDQCLGVAVLAEALSCGCGRAPAFEPLAHRAVERGELGWPKIAGFTSATGSRSLV
jgi:hypothetical protein